MTEVYRQKLLNWLASMGVLVLFTNLSMAAFWFFNRPAGRIRTYDANDETTVPDGWNIIDWAGPMGEILFSVFSTGFLFCAIWHLFDVVQRRPAQTYPASLVSSYSPFILTLAFLGLLTALTASGRFTYTACARNADGEIMFGFDGCGQYLAPWIEWPAWIAMLVLVALMLGKGIIAFTSVRSRHD